MKLPGACCLMQVFMSLTALNQFASSLLLSLMSFDRYLAICHPIFSQRYRHPKPAKLTCLVLWIACIVLMTPIVSVYNVLDSSMSEFQYNHYLIYLFAKLSLYTLEQTRKTKRVAYFGQSKYTNAVAAASISYCVMNFLYCLPSSGAGNLKSTSQKLTNYHPKSPKP